MAYTYSVESARRLIRIQLSPQLTRDEIHAMVNELNADPRVAPDFVELIDCSDLIPVADVGADRIRAMATGSLARVSRRAFVAPQPAIFGTCRMFAAFFEMANRGESIAVFKTTREAEEWLGV